MSPAWPSNCKLIYTTSSATATFPDGSLYEISANGNAKDVQRIGPAGERERSVSPDGSSVLFLTRDWEIAQLSFSTGVITILSHQPYGTWDLEAAWSPDGKAIAFGCNFSPTAKVGRSDICVMAADGSNRRVLIHRTDASEWVSWSPDGKWLAFQADRNNYTEGAIIVTNVETGRSLDITANTRYALNETPAWSPDGKWIALQVKTSDGYRIALIRPNGSGFRLLTQG